MVKVTGCPCFEVPLGLAVRPDTDSEPCPLPVLIARVVRLPAFMAGLKDEMARRFCCRRPTCDPSARRLPQRRRKGALSANVRGLKFMKQREEAN